LLEMVQRIRYLIIFMIMYWIVDIYSSSLRIKLLHMKNIITKNINKNISKSKD
jgi:hypothetical protein